jgi:hypothetical protein
LHVHILAVDFPNHNGQIVLHHPNSCLEVRFPGGVSTPRKPLSPVCAAANDTWTIATKSTNGV